MRKRLIGAVLSLAMAVSGVFFVGQSMPAQAAGQDNATFAAKHNHVFLNPVGKSAEYYEESNSTYHFVYVDVTYQCGYTGCIQTAVSKEQKGYEEHIMWGVAPTPYRASCLKCGYQE